MTQCLQCKRFSLSKYWSFTCRNIFSHVTRVQESVKTAHQLELWSKDVIKGLTISVVFHPDVTFSVVFLLSIILSFFPPSHTFSILRRRILLGKTFQGWVSPQPIPYRPGDSQHGKLWSKHQQISVVRHTFPKLRTVAQSLKVSRQGIMLCFVCVVVSAERTQKYVLTAQPLVLFTFLLFSVKKLPFSPS